MAKVLVYTSPARGHLFPIVPTMRELARRGHSVCVRTLASEVEEMRGLGFDAARIDPQIEAREIDDHKASTPPGALLAAGRTFVDRARVEITDLPRAIEETGADVLFVDINSWGATAAAQASGKPWAAFAPYFMPVRAPGVPPWGLGLAQSTSVFGKMRDAIAWPLVDLLFDRVLGDLNRVRADVGVPRLRHVTDFARVPPRVVAYTAEPFEYARAWPASFRLVGPGIWEPPGEKIAGDDPIVLVTCSTEYQNDGRIIEIALAGLAEENVHVVATTASIDPKSFAAPANARIERFLPHEPLLARASCVVCHGGMGITQKALSAGVPVCVVPFGRDQLEVARHVEVAGAGVRLLPKHLTPARLRDAVREAAGKKAGAERIAAAFARAGGAKAAADAVLEALESPREEIHARAA
jgi:MGT family glycosyltransferase